MIKDNHIIAEANFVKLIKKAIKTKKIITVEIDNISQLKKIIGLIQKKMYKLVSLKNLIKKITFE